jgi:acyl-CoA synthetase (AMP-forming)/AMP-acid ligase II/acyl carrier protein
LVKKFNRFSTDILLENIYGPTEAAVYACGYSLSLWDGKSDIPIGKPIRNLSLYILDKYDKLQGVGIVGELSIGGVSAARGYLNNPGLTAEKFVENPYLSHTTHLYKTGDLARWLPNGTIEFLGRQDQQVKIRGYRVEPGEIEGHLLGIEGIKEAVVIDREEEQGYKHLCAYIVPDEVQRKRVSKAQVKGEFAIDIAAVKNELLKELPDYMIPSYFVEIDAVPLTPGGKVDRKVLPAPAMEAGTDYRAPGNELEKRLVEIWSEILSIDKNVIGIDDNFFEIGGHSLRATILASRLHKEFNVNIRLIELFSIPTVIGIANLISINKSRRERIIAESEEREKVLL